MKRKWSGSWGSPETKREWEKKNCFCKNKPPWKFYDAYLTLNVNFTHHTDLRYALLTCHLSESETLKELDIPYWCNILKRKNIIFRVWSVYRIFLLCCRQRKENFRFRDFKQFKVHRKISFLTSTAARQYEREKLLRLLFIPLDRL